MNGNPELLDFLEISTTAAQKSIFIAAFLKFLPTAFDQLDKKPDDPFSLFTTWFGGYADSKSLYSCIYAALQRRQRYLLETQFQKQQFITHIGLDWTADDKSTFFSKVISACGFLEESSFLSRLPLYMCQS